VVTCANNNPVDCALLAALVMRVGVLAATGGGRDPRLTPGKP